MGHEGIHAIEQIRDLTVYLQRYFQHELTGETTVEIAIRLLNKTRLQKLEVTEEFIERQLMKFPPFGYGEPRAREYLKQMLKEAGIEVVKR